MNAPTESHFLLVICVLFFVHLIVSAGLCFWLAKRKGDGVEKPHDKLFEIVTKKRVITCEVPRWVGYYLWFGFAALATAVLIWRFWGERG